MVGCGHLVGYGQCSKVIRVPEDNVVFFGLPENCNVTKEQLTQSMLDDYGVKILGGYSSGGRLFRLVTHMDVDKEGIERTLDGILSLCCR